MRPSQCEPHLANSFKFDLEFRPILSASLSNDPERAAPLTTPAHLSRFRPPSRWIPARNDEYQPPTECQLRGHSHRRSARLRSRRGAEENRACVQPAGPNPRFSPRKKPPNRDREALWRTNHRGTSIPPRAKRPRFSANCVKLCSSREEAISRSDSKNNLMPAKVLGPSKSSEGQYIFYLIQWLSL